MTDGKTGGKGASDPRSRAWAHRQNIQRYEALLRRDTDRESRLQIMKLLREEEEKLRSLSET